MRITNKNSNRIKIKNEELEETETFCYFRSVINKNGDIKEEITIRIGKAASAFKKLNIWKSRKTSGKTKIKLYKSK